MSWRPPAKSVSQAHEESVLTNKNTWIPLWPGPVRVDPGNSRVAMMTEHHCAALMPMQDFSHTASVAIDALESAALF